MASLNIYSGRPRHLDWSHQQTRYLIVAIYNDLQRKVKTNAKPLKWPPNPLTSHLNDHCLHGLRRPPLIAAQGAGAVSRYNIGLIIATGISIGTLFTLFVVPSMYLLIADDLSEKAAEGELAPDTGL